jgi:chaperonin GroEL (HSP60 family)
MRLDGNLTSGSSKSSRKVSGSGAIRVSIFAAKSLAEILQTSLGPKGLHKMVIDPYGNLIVSNDGIAILSDLEVKNPIAKMIVDLAKVQEKIVGDGTKKTVIFAGELLKNAVELSAQKISPISIVQGYKVAAKKSLEILDKIAIQTQTSDKATLSRVALTALDSKISHGKEKLAQIAVNAVHYIMQRQENRIFADIRERVLIRKKEGPLIADSKLIHGIIINKEVAHPSMPKRIEKAKILLTNQKLYLEKRYTTADAMFPELRISTPKQMKAFIHEERAISEKWFEAIVRSGANVVISSMGIDRALEELMARSGILAVRRADLEAFKLLELACGGKVVGKIEDSTPECLGYADLVEERVVGGGVRADRMVFVEGCRDPKSVSVLLRGSTWEIVEEVERAFKNAVSAVANVLQYNGIVGGGGSVEMELTVQLRKYGLQVGGKEQLAIKAFADALEKIPRCLAFNAGANPLDIIPKLRSMHENGDCWACVCADDGRVADAAQLGVLEPVNLIRHMIKSATEVAAQIIRIDGIYDARENKIKVDISRGLIPKSKPQI